MTDKDQEPKTEPVPPEAEAATTAPAEAAGAAPPTETAAPAEASAPAAGSEPGVPSLEPSEEMKKALNAAVESFEAGEEKKRKKAEEPPPPSPAEMKLKMEILDLRHRVRDLEKDLEKKVKEIKQNYDQGMMLKNQFEAYKARALREKADFFNYGHEPVLKELLAVLDNLERALQHANRPEDFEGLKQGIQLTYRQFLKTLEGFGVKQIESQGAPFNPSFHEALAQVPSPDLPPGTVIEEHNKGYLLKDRLLRAARVTISTSPVPGGETRPPAPEPGTASEAKSDPTGNPSSQEDKKP